MPDAPLLSIRRRAALLGALATAAAGTRPRDTPIPIVLDVSQGRCLLPVLLDGRPARMVLDTGAEMTVITRATVVRLGLRPDPWVGTTLQGAGGLLERYANADIGVARAGGVTLVQSLHGGGLNLPVTNTDLGGADGLLGGDILRHYTLDLDIRAARLTLLPPVSQAADPGAVRLQPLRRVLLLAPVRLDGHTLVALLDTGASASMVNARGLYRMGLLPDRAAHDPAISAHGLGGAFSARQHRFAELRLGATRLANPLLLTAIVPEAAFDMTLGLDVLGQQRLLVSYAALALGMSPDRAPM